MFEVYQVSSSRYREEAEPQEALPKSGGRKGLYIYPNAEESITVMDWDDLNPDSLLVLCISSEAAKRAFVWRGICFEGVSAFAKTHLARQTRSSSSTAPSRTSGPSPAKIYKFMNKHMIKKIKIS